MLWRAIKALGAAITITALLAGIPIALALLGHNPLPALTDFAHHPAARDDGALFLAVFAIVGWIAWLSFAVAVIAEAPSLFGRSTRQLPGLSAQQWLARTLLSAVAAAVVSPTITTANAAAIDHHDVGARVAAVTVHIEELTAPTVAAGETAAAQAVAHDPVHVARRGEVLLDLAERYYGDRGAMKAIAEANYGVAQPDGRTLERGQTRIYPGWRLRLPTHNGITPASTPAVASPTPEHAAAPPTPVSATAASNTANSYEVCRGDTLWDIASAQLGDPEAWHDIWALNKGKTFDDGRTFTRPGLIHPGWVLALPDAPAGHTPTATPQVANPPPQSHLDKHDHDDAEPADDGVRVPPTPSSQVGASAQDASPAQATAGPATNSDTGVPLPSGSWISLGLAAALAAAARMAWLHRRRRYTPRPPSAVPRTTDPDLTPTPAVIRHLRRHTETQPPHETASAAPCEQRRNLSTQAPNTPLAPAANLIQLTGHRAAATARGILISALAAGDHDIDQRGHIVMSIATLRQLLPTATARDLELQPRLTIIPDDEAALDWCEQHLLSRARTLAEYDVTDAATLRETSPFAEPMPPITLIAGLSQRTARTDALLAQGAAVNLNGVTVPDDADNDEPADAIPQPVADSRPATLTVEETLHLLRTLTESQTGHPQPPRQATDEQKPALPADDPVNANIATREEQPLGHDTPTGEPDTSHSAGRAHETPHDIPERTPVRISVLGPVQIHDPRNAPKTNRTKSLELLVYLIAVGGRASTNTIIEDLLPDAPMQKAAERLHTNVYGLGQLLMAAGGGTRDDYITHPPGFYILKPDHLDVDLWHFRDAMGQAAKATTPAAEADALRQALDNVRGPFADGSDYEWMEPISVGITRQVLDARIALARALAKQNKPDEALAMLQLALDDEPLAEDLYMQAMDLHAAKGDADAIRRLRRIATHLLESEGLDPTDDLRSYADRLLANLRRRRTGQALRAATEFADAQTRR